MSEIDPAAWDWLASPQKESKINCFGLFSIREELASIGGSMETKSHYNKGSSITISAPYKSLNES